MAYKRKTLTGQTKHPLYPIWQAMKGACRNPKSLIHQLRDRPIQVCKAWQTFPGFVQDMFPSYLTGMVLVRQDENLDFTPKNCSWGDAGYIRKPIRMSLRGQSEHPLYRIYHNMLAQHRNSDFPFGYVPPTPVGHYTVCKTWLRGFEFFVRDMEPTHQPDMALRRHDKTKDFSRANCYWAPKPPRKPRTTTPASEE